MMVLFPMCFCRSLRVSGTNRISRSLSPRNDTTDGHDEHHNDDQNRAVHRRPKHRKKSRGGHRPKRRKNPKYAPTLNIPSLQSIHSEDESDIFIDRASPKPDERSPRTISQTASAPQRPQTKRRKLQCVLDDIFREHEDTEDALSEPDDVMNAEGMEMAADSVPETNSKQNTLSIEEDASSFSVNLPQTLCTAPFIDFHLDPEDRPSVGGRRVHSVSSDVNSFTLCDGMDSVESMGSPLDTGKSVDSAFVVLRDYAAESALADDDRKYQMKAALSTFPIHWMFFNIVTL